MKYLTFILLVTLAQQGQSQTPRITFTAPLLYPEGTVYYPQKDLFFVSSVKTATIGSVDRAGKYKVFYEDSTLKSSYGMKIDSLRKCLWICTGDTNYSKYSDSSTYKKKALLLCLDLTTGKKLKEIDLAALYKGKHFANDLAIDANGNIYVSDSYSPVIYRIEKDGRASILAESELFQSVDVGLNGLAWHPKGYLLAVHGSSGAIYRVGTTGNAAVNPVKTDQFFPGADGVMLDANGDLLLIQNKGVNRVFRLTSKDDWASATVTARTAAEDNFQYPTTGTLAKGRWYVLNARLNEITDPSITPSKEFSLQEVIFRPNL